MKQELTPLQIAVSVIAVVVVVVIIGIVSMTAHPGAKAPAPGPGNYPGEKARTVSWTPPAMQQGGGGGQAPGTPTVGASSPGAGSLTTTP